VGIVDVPGHERFLKNALSGLCGVDIVLLAVDAAQGVSAQTREHARILRGLGVPRVIGVLTKCDAVDADLKALAVDEARGFLDACGWADAPLCCVSARTGAGLDDLKRAVARACNGLEEKRAAEVAEAERPFRMAIDRVFSIAGRGTVVTGSVAQGRVRVEDALEVVRVGAGTLPARARSLESHGQPVEILERGQRGALNLAGLGVEAIESGSALSTPGLLVPSARWDAWIAIDAGAPRAVKKRAPLRLHLGTAEVGATPVFEPEVLEPGEGVVARLRLDRALAGAVGDRFILREVSSERVLGSGLLLRSAAGAEKAAPQMFQMLRARRQVLERGGEAPPLLLSLLEENPGADVGFLACGLRLLKASRALQVLVSGGQAVQIGARAWRREDFEALLSEAEERLRAEHARHAAVDFVSAAALDVDAAVVEEGARRGLWHSENGLLRHAERAGKRDEAGERLAQVLAGAAKEAGWRLLSPEELASAAPGEEKAAREVLAGWLRTGAWARVGQFVAPKTLLEAAGPVLEEAFGQGSTCSVSQAGAALGVSRKWAVPLLEWFDRNGWTRREGEARVRGARLRREE
jgi:selenocysteine-specific elongation factor